MFIVLLAHKYYCSLYFNIFYHNNMLTTSILCESCMFVLQCFERPDLCSLGIGLHITHGRNI